MASKLVWDEVDAKDCFYSHRMWTNFPTSILPDQKLPLKKCKEDDQSRNLSKIPLPLLLWPEQKSRMDMLNAQKQAPNRSRKRKRELVNRVESGSSKVEEIEASAKRPKLFSSFADILDQSKNFLTSVYQYFYPTAPSAANNTNLLPNQPSAASSSTDATAPVASSSSKETAELKRPKSYQQQAFDLFHDKGYLVGPGDAYGGNYTLYKGNNPSKSHSSATVLVLPSHTIPARDLLAFTRVQNQVAKSAVVVFPSKDEDGTAKPDFVVLNFKSVSVRL